jgi:TRAP-type C4-dicarboxylate transport system substrate-binding protein
MKKCRLTTVSVLCVMGFMFFLWIPAAPAQQKPIKLTYSHFWPVGHPVTALLADWAKEVEKRTNGRVAVIIFPAGTLTPADKIYDGVVKGISNLGSSAMSYTRGRFPLMEVVDLPLGYKNATIATNLTNALYKKFQPKELNDTKVMYFQAHGPGIFHTKKPVRSLEELKGMKIRTTGLGTKIVTALGATPVAMTMGETYDALAKGVVDGSIAPISSLAGFRWGEVVKYTTENFGSAYTAAFFVVMNKNTWNGLPPEVQKIIEGVNEEWIKKTGLVWDEYDNMGRDFALKLGNQIIRLSAEEDELWVKKVSVTFDDYLKDMEKKGLPGTEALEFCRDFLKKN